MKFEYLITDIDLNTGECCQPSEKYRFPINELGDLGWELVFVMDFYVGVDTSLCKGIFKRQKEKWE